MNKKWFFSITMLILCVSALAVGVFAVQKSTISIAGNFYIQGSNCSFSVRCDINNFADENGQKSNKSFEQNILATNTLVVNL